LTFLMVLIPRKVLTCQCVCARVRRLDRCVILRAPRLFLRTLCLLPLLCPRHLGQLPRRQEPFRKVRVKPSQEALCFIILYEADLLLREEEPRRCGDGVRKQDHVASGLELEQKILEPRHEGGADAHLVRHAAEHHNLNKDLLRVFLNGRAKDDGADSTTTCVLCHHGRKASLCGSGLKEHRAAEFAMSMPV
jgi:hypothetical protein